MDLKTLFESTFDDHEAAARIHEMHITLGHMPCDALERETVPA